MNIGTLLPISTQAWAQIILWISQALYIACFIPQIITNYRQKTGRGLSDLFLIGYLNGYLTLLYYVFCLDLPLVYKISGPACSLAVLILIAQRLYYDAPALRKTAQLIFGGNIAFGAAFIPAALIDMLQVGAIFGWLNVLISMVNQLPQVVQIYQTKSVEGFSFMFIVLMAIAALFETVSSLMLGLPSQTIVNALRGLLVCFIFFWQFRLYSKH